MGNLRKVFVRSHVCLHLSIHDALLVQRATIRDESRRDEFPVLPTKTGYENERKQISLSRAHHLCHSYLAIATYSVTHTTLSTSFLMYVRMTASINQEVCR